MTRYRLDRAHLMVAAGVCFLVAAVGVLTAFLTAGKGDVGSTVAFLASGLAGVAIVLAAVLNLRPPTVVTLDVVGLRARGRGGDAPWKQVQDVSVADGMLRFSLADGTVSALPLGLVDRRQRAELLRDVYDRLNTAHGYRRFEPSP